MKCLLLFVFFAISLTCIGQNPANSAEIWKKIRLDFKSLDKEGMAGVEGSKVEQNYEFCIPTERRYWKKVKQTDPSAKKSQGKGRVGCSDGEWLIIGCTHQKNYQRVLYDLASLPFVKRIEPVYWE